MRFYFTRSSRRHKVGRGHALAALANGGAPIVREGPRGVELHWLAPDDRGVELHLVGRPSGEDPMNLAVIFHVQPTDQRRPR